jgi:hypothetical protein
MDKQTLRAELRARRRARSEAELAGLSLLAILLDGPLLQQVLSAHYLDLLQLLE